MEIFERQRMQSQHVNRHLMKSNLSKTIERMDCWQRQVLKRRMAMAEKRSSTESESESVGDAQSGVRPAKPVAIPFLVW